MNKYAPFTNYLKSQSTNHVTLTFARIERIIGDSLPPSARKHIRWWDNIPGSVEADARLDAGFQVIMVDLENEIVRLRRA